MLIAHGPISYLLNEKFQRKDIGRLDKSNRILVSLLALLFGILPDFDMFLLVSKHLPTFLHHSIFTHSLTFWIGAWILLRIFFSILSKSTHKEKFLSSNVLTIIEKSFLIGTVSHILADFLFNQVRLFFPLSNLYTMLGGIVGSSLFTGYTYSLSMALEILILVIFAFYIYKTFFKKDSFLTGLLYVLISISVVYLSFSVFISFNTYNVATNSQNGNRIYDADFDMVLDRRDFDTDNNFVNNIDDTDYHQLAQDTLNILNSGSFTSTKDNLIENIYFKLGAFNSYRLISQAYFEQNKSIEPVLEEYARTKDGLRSYDLDLEYDELLFDYFKGKNRILSLPNLQAETVSPGMILFVTDTDGNIANMGVILEDNKIGIVLETDTRMQVHTFSEIQNLYEDNLLYVQI